MRLLLKLTLFMLFMTLLSAYAASGLIISDDVTLRKEANTDAEKLATIAKGTRVEILGTSNNWFKVSFEKKTGFVRDDLLVKIKEEKKSSFKALTRYVSGDNVVVRKSASTDSDKLTTLKNNTKITCIDQDGDWYKVEVESVSGYIRKDLLTDSKQKEEEAKKELTPEELAAQEAKKAENEAKKAAQAAEKAAQQAERDSVVEILQNQEFAPDTISAYALPDNPETLNAGHEGDAVSALQKALHYLGYFDSEVDGYFGESTAMAVLAFQSGNDIGADGVAGPKTQKEIYHQYNLISDVLQYAATLLGTPYKRAGRSPETGFDCSGYTRYVFSNFGISLGASSNDQNSNGISVPLAKIRPGDLITFGPNIHHVGIYVGNGKYIHSPDTGDVVKYSKLSDEKKDTMYGRRVIGR